MGKRKVEEPVEEEEVEAPLTEKKKKKKKVEEVVEEEPVTEKKKKKKNKAAEEDVEMEEVATEKKKKKKNKDAEEEAPASPKKSPKKAPAADPDDGEGPFKAFVKGLPYAVDEAKLQKDFGACGTIEEVKILKDEEGWSRGIAFVTFSAKAALKKCCEEWNEKEYDGRWLVVNEADGGKGKGKGKGKGSGEKPENCLGVFVGSLSPNVEEDDLWEFFGECGTVSQVKVLTDRETGAPRGIAFVDFEETASTDKAVAKSGTNLKGKEMFVKFNAPREGKGDKGGKGGKGKGGPGEKPDGCLGVFVGSLSPDVEEDDLWELFGECGTVARVKVLTDQDTGAPRGIAFVDFEETDSTDKAVKLSGKSVKGKEIFVKFNAPREKKGGKDGKDGKGKGKGKKGKGKGPPSESRSKATGGLMEFKGSAKTFGDDSD